MAKKSETFRIRTYPFKHNGGCGTEQVLEVEGQSFQVDIAGLPVVLVVHESHDRHNQWTVTEKITGRLFLVFSDYEKGCLTAYNVAKRRVCQFLTERDPASIRQVIEAAQKNPLPC